MSDSTKAKQKTQAVSGKRLYVFSSNVRPLYVQHVLNILAMPAGQRTTLRYSSQWVNDAAEEAWGPALTGVPVLMHFALQQEAQYVVPAFFPIRSGCVVNASKEGRYHFLEVAVDDYVALKWPPSSNADQPRAEDLANQVRRYQSFLEARKIDRPYPSSAALAIDVLDEARADVLDTAAADDPSQLHVELFRRSAEYLIRAEPFRNARFIRFLRLVERNADRASVKSKLSGDPPRLELTAGRTYEIEIFSFQPRGVDRPELFTISADGVAVQAIGRPDFEVASRYDRIKVPIRTNLPANAKPVHTLVVVEPATGVQGPRIELPIEVHERRGVRSASVAGAVLSLGLLVSASLVGPATLKATLLSAGLLLAFALQSLGRPIASLVGPAASGVPVRPAPPMVIVEAAETPSRGLPPARHGSGSWV